MTDEEMEVIEAARTGSELPTQNMPPDVDEETRRRWVLEACDALGSHATSAHVTALIGGLWPELAATVADLMQDCLLDEIDVDGVTIWHVTATGVETLWLGEEE